MASLLKRAALALAVLASAGSAVAQNVGERVDAGTFQLQALEAQNLKAGSCALFLWSRSERPVFILFAPDNPAKATVRIDGRIRTLDRKTTSGARVLGHFEKQSFAGGKYAFEIELVYDQNRPIQEGAIIDHGVLRTRDAKGVVTVVPIGGMIGCRKAKGG